MSELHLQVECYSGRKGDERPIRFRLDGNEYQVEDVLDQWYSLDATFFKVKANDGNLYILRQSLGDYGEWELVSFRQSR